MEPPPVTVTVAIAFAKPAAEPVMVDVPGPTAVTGIFTLVALAAIMKLLGVTVATPVLLEETVTERGEGDGTESLRVRLPLVPATRLRVFDAKLMTADTATLSVSLV